MRRNITLPRFVKWCQTNIGAVDRQVGNGRWSPDSLAYQTTLGQTTV